MSRETRDRLMAQLTTFYETGDAGGSRFAGEDGLDENGEGYVTADSDELEDEGEVDMGLGWEAGSGDEGEGKGRFVEVDEDDEDSSDDDDGPTINLMEMEDSDDEAGGAGGASEPPKTKHEVEDDQAVVPDVQVLPDGERLVLAGEVMSVILHVKAVEAEARVELDVTVVSSVSKEEGGEQAVVEAPSAAGEGKQDTKETTAEEAAVETAPSAPSSSVPAKPATTGPKQTKAMKLKAKKEQKQRAKSSGTIVVKALRPPLETEGLGGLRIGDDEGWLEEGSVICLEDRRVLAVVSIDDVGRYS
jgi:H/ACA ribonucleoprotein complex non-core subunit NAF1